MDRGGRRSRGRDLGVCIMFGGVGGCGEGWELSVWSWEETLTVKLKVLNGCTRCCKLHLITVYSCNMLQLNDIAIDIAHYQYNSASHIMNLSCSRRKGKTTRQVHVQVQGFNYIALLLVEKKWNWMLCFAVLRLPLFPQTEKTKL